MTGSRDLVDPNALISSHLMRSRPHFNAVSRELDPALLEGDLNVAIASLEHSMIWRAIEACGGNRAEAARHPSPVALQQDAQVRASCS
jgi:hypothetical protein